MSARLHDAHMAKVGPLSRSTAQQWFRAMERILIAQESWDYVDGTEPTDGTPSTRAKGRANAMLLIETYCGDDAMAFVTGGDSDNPRDIWNRLRTEYGKTDEMGSVWTMGNWLRASFLEGDDMEKWLADQTKFRNAVLDEDRNARLARYTSNPLLIVKLPEDKDTTPSPAVAASRDPPSICPRLARNILIHHLPQRWADLLPPISFDTTWDDITSFLRARALDEQQRQRKESHQAFTAYPSSQPRPSQTRSSQSRLLSHSHNPSSPRLSQFPPSSSRAPSASSISSRRPPFVFGTKGLADRCTNAQAWHPGVSPEGYFNLLKGQCHGCLGLNHLGRDCPIPRSQWGAQKKMRFGRLNIGVPEGTRWETLFAGLDESEPEDRFLAAMASGATLEEAFADAMGESDEEVSPFVIPQYKVYSAQLFGPDGDKNDFSPSTLATFLPPTPPSTPPLFLATPFSANISSTATSPSIPDLTSNAPAILDSGASVHYVVDKGLLHGYRAFIEPVPIRGAFKSIGYALGCGSLHPLFPLSDGLVARPVFANAVYAPEMGVNLVSSRQLMKKGIRFTNDRKAVTLADEDGTILGFCDIGPSNISVRATWDTCQVEG